MKEKGNGEDQVRPFRKNRSKRWIHEVALIDDSFLAGPGNPGGGLNSDQYMHFMQLSAEYTAQAALLFCFEESSTRLD